MKNKKLISSIIAIISLAGVLNAQRTPATGFAKMTFNKTKFDQNLQNAVGPNVIG
jgi:hypothetical protein